MQLDELFPGSSQDATFFYLKIPAMYTPEGLAVFVLLTVLAKLEGFLTTNDGETLTTKGGVALTYELREKYPELQLFKWKTYIEDNYIFNEFVVTNSEEYTPPIDDIEYL